MVTQQCVLLRVRMFSFLLSLLDIHCDFQTLGRVAHVGRYVFTDVSRNRDANSNNFRTSAI